jgi:pimeloyl-ACP methyl ester carboxylesterase
MSDARAIRHGRADLGDVRLHYATAGEGPAVLLLHGWPRTWYMWRGVIPGLFARHSVIAPDLRGLGDSSRPAGGYDKKTLARDVWRLAQEALGEERLFVEGHDWGGPVAFARPRRTPTPCAGWRCSKCP